MGRIKDRKGMNLKEAEKIKKSWKEYTEELYKKKILECEVKWALGSIAINKASGSDGIPAELFQVLKEFST